MNQAVFDEWLRDAWQLGIGAFFGYLIIDKSWRIVFEHFHKSMIKGMVTTLMLTSCLVWALSFINVTYIEQWALGVAFEDYQKPPLNFLHISLAIIFGILFAVLVSNGWRLAVVLPLALTLALADIAGNATLIEGVQTMAARAEAQGDPFGAPQLAWLDYYTAYPHLLRIQGYAAVLGVAALLAAIALAIYWRDNRAARRDDAAEAPSNAASPNAASPNATMSKAAMSGAAPAVKPAPVESAPYLTLRYLSSLVFCIALVGNLVVVWSWRLERECRLAAFEMSFVYSDPAQCGG